MLGSSSAWTILKKTFSSSFEIIKVAAPEPSIFFWIPASIAEAAAVIANEANFFLPKELLLSLMKLLFYLIMSLKLLEIELF